MNTTKNIFLYAGYYELYITDKPMNKPFILLSRHVSAQDAAHTAEKREDHYYFNQNILPEEYNHLLDCDNTKIHNIQNQNFITY